MRADAGAAQLVEILDELGRQEQPIARGEVGDPLTAALELADLLLEVLAMWAIASANCSGRALSTSSTRASGTPASDRVLMRIRSSTAWAP